MTDTAAEREGRVSGVAAGWINTQGLPDGIDQVLVVDDEDGAIERAVAKAGATVRPWRRRALDNRKASPWPAEGTADLAILRLPRDWAAFALQVDAARSRLAPGGRLWVVGANDEGIKSAPGRLSRELGPVEVETLWIKARCRVLEARIPATAPAPRGALAAWREEVRLDLPEVGERSLVSYPGLFAHGHLDEGSALLLSALLGPGAPAVPAGARVLDLGCGAGALSVALAARQPQARLVLADVDAVAVAAARENLPDATVLLGDSWGAVELGARFNLVLSNPPLHRGQAEDHRVLEALVQQGPLRLVQGGRMVIVSWRTATVGKLLTAAFGKAELLAEDRRFEVWQARAR